MKCIYCGEDLKEGSLFCSHCGKAVQIVPDYNVYEEDYLKQVLAEENGIVSPSAPTGDRNQKETGQPEEKRSKQQKKKQRRIIFGVIGVVCVLVFALLVLGAAIRSNNNNSFDYQVEQAEKAKDSGDIDKAIEYYENALSIDQSNIDVRLALAELYMEKDDPDAALVLYQEVLRMDKKNREATENLIAIYEERENTDAILALYDAVDDSLKDLFSDYLVTPPEFDLEEGTFDTEQTLALSSSGQYEIYYTLDGTDPSSQGEHYTAPIELNENDKTYVVKAVCVNEKNIYSDVVTKQYQISIPAPDMPIVTPDGGDFGAATNVTITVPDGCTAYYTWDGTTPTANSSRYTGPIPIPEGNNVLSAILIDSKTGLRSDVYRGNFVYYVENFADEDNVEEEE
jgi:predicted  nucleic acid-binding Zn-ribbon protein